MEKDVSTDLSMRWSGQSSAKAHKVFTIGRNMSTVSFYGEEVNLGRDGEEVNVGRDGEEVNIGRDGGVNVGMGRSM